MTINFSSWFNARQKWQQRAFLGLMYPVLLLTLFIMDNLAWVLGLGGVTSFAYDLASWPVYTLQDIVDRFLLETFYATYFRDDFVQLHACVNVFCSDNYCYEQTMTCMHSLNYLYAFFYWNSARIIDWFGY